MTTIEIDNITIHVLRKPIKHMHVRIYPPDGTVRVSAPMRLSLRYIRQQLETKREWIHAQREKILQRPISLTPTLQEGETVFFLGEPYAIQVIETTSAPQVLCHEKTLQLHIKPGTSPLEKHRLLNTWSLKHMQSLVPPLIQKWEPRMGVTVTAWGAKTMKTRWGSCNTHTGRIWLNLTLMQKSKDCIEYVLVHEMVHLLEASHNARFYELMDHFLPEWRIHQKALY